MRRYLLLFAILTSAYHSNLRPVASGDSLPASLVPFSILLDGSLTLDRFGPYIRDNVRYSASVVRETRGHWYSVYPIAGPVLATPLYLPVLLVPRLGDQPPATLIAAARIAEKVAAVTLATATVMLLLPLLGRIAPARAAWWLTLVFAFGTGNWSTASQALWQHTFGQLAIIGCLHAVDRWRVEPLRPFWIAGALAGLAVAIRPTNAVLLPALVAALWIQRARRADYLRVLAPAATGAALVAAYNFFIWRNVAGVYGPAFRIHLDREFLDGLFGILASPGRGLFIYTPVAVFALAAFIAGARQLRERHRAVVTVAAVFSAAHIAAVAMWPVWWGGYCWGPRLLTEIFAPAMVLIAVGLPAIQGRGLKGAFAGVVVWCCLIQAMGVYSYPKGRWDHLPVSVNDAPARLWDWRDNPVVRTARGGIAWEPYAVIEAAATGGLPAAAKKLQELGIAAH